MSHNGHRTARQMVEDVLLGIPEGQTFTLEDITDSMRPRQAPTRREISNILTHGHLATFRDGTWHREAA